jgi:hypothetical protein
MNSLKASSVLIHRLARSHIPSQAPSHVPVQAIPLLALVLAGRALSRRRGIRFLQEVADDRREARTRPTHYCGLIPIGTASRRRGLLCHTPAPRLYATTEQWGQCARPATARGLPLGPASAVPALDCGRATGSSRSPRSPLHEKRRTPHRMDLPRSPCCALVHPSSPEGETMTPLGIAYGKRPRL